MSLAHPLDDVAGYVPSRVRYYDGRQTAKAVGLSWERFRKVREAWVRQRDFPAEINEAGEPVRYLADAVDRWLERRSRRVVAPSEAPRRAPGPAQERQAAAAGRAGLRAIKTGGR